MTAKQDTSQLANSANQPQTVIDSKTSSPTMHVKVYSPFQTYFDQEALSISAINATGPFDILPKHHNFMTLLSPCDLSIRTPDGAGRIVRISQGIMHVKADRVIVFLDV